MLYNLKWTLGMDGLHRLFVTYSGLQSASWFLISYRKYEDDTATFVRNFPALFSVGSPPLADTSIRPPTGPQIAGKARRLSK